MNKDARSLPLRLLALLFTTIALLTACATSSPPLGIAAVKPFELQRYQGQWYELARLDHIFERGLTDASARYQAQADGSVRVVNRGFDPAKGEWREVTGKALFTGAHTVGSLNVSFFGPFYGGYPVAGLGPGYRWGLVVGADRGYFWGFARGETPSATAKTAIVTRAKALGIGTDALIWVSQERTDPALAGKP